MRIILTLFFVFYGYAVVRYHFGKQLDISYFLFVFNKAVAWSAASVSLPGTAIPNQEQANQIQVLVRENIDFQKELIGTK